MARVCPQCGGSMAEENHLGVKVDVCRACGGLWLDKGEIARLRSLGSERMEAVDEAIQPAARARPGRRLTCPACSKELKEFGYCGSEVRLDTCERLCGLWVENGELTQIAALEGTAAKNPEVALYAAEVDQQVRRHEITARVLKVLNRRRHGWSRYF